MRYYIASFTIGLTLIVLLANAEEQILFVSKRDGNQEIYKQVFGGKLKRLTFDGGSDFDPALSPDGTKMAYVSTINQSFEIAVMDLKSGKRQQLTFSLERDLRPTWAPDGKRIAFSSDRDGIFDLYLMNPDGKNVQKMFKDNEYRREPAWSPNGKHIAYAQADKQKAIRAFGARFAPRAEHTLYIAAPNGTSIEKLTKGFEPSWSPDGTQLIFVVVGLKHSSLGLFDLQTRTQKVLRPEKLRWSISPCWSPQGDKIAFGKLGGARFNERGGISFRSSTLYIANPDGTALQQVADGNALDPTWSPHGNQLIYSNTIADVFQVYKTDFNGGNPTQLTRAGNNFGADWSNPNVLEISPSVHSLTTTWGKIKVN